MNKARFAALAALAIISGPVQAASDCPKLPKTVPLKVDSIDNRSEPYVLVTVSGVPSGWYVKCAVRDKDGTYLGTKIDGNKWSEPIMGPAHTVLVRAARSKDAVGADCIAINPAKEEE